MIIYYFIHFKLFRPSMKENLLNNYFGEEKKEDNILISTTFDNNKSQIKTSISSEYISSDKFSDFSDPRKIYYIIILSEIIAILSVSSGEISNKVSENSHRHYGTVLSFIYYLTFGLFWIIFNHGMTKPKFSYFLILLFDTQTNFYIICCLINIYIH